MKKIEHENLYEELQQQKEIELFRKEPLMRHTSLRVGGPADYFIFPLTDSSLVSLVGLLNRAGINYHVMGAGSNVIAADSGVRGVVISLRRLKNVTVKGCSVTAQAGISLAGLAEVAAWHELSGLEFASGIPGTLGGAIFMNAGAYGGEMKDVVKRVKAFDYDSETMKTLSKNDLNLDYRSSLLQDSELLALEVDLELEKGNRNKILHRTAELESKRWFKQPLTYPSAGSTFKRPEDDYAGRLIDAAGLKGRCVGDACVSKKHAGFIINRGRAKASEVLKLMKIVQKEVKRKFDVTLEPEPRPLGDFPQKQLETLFPDGTSV